MPQLKAGPKRTAREDLVPTEHLPRDEALRRIEFCQEHLVTPSGAGAREPWWFRHWQREIVKGLYAPGVRSGLLSVARGNGKTQLAAVLAVASLFLDGEQAQVLTVASTEQQARHVFRAAVRMIELAPALAARCKVYTDKVVYVPTDSFLAPVPALASALQGYAPSFVVVDELHVVPADVWEAMARASGKRDRSLTLAISTAAGDREGPMWALTEYGRGGGDASFFFREFTAPEDLPIDDPETWKLANPAMDDFLSRDAVAANLRDTRESQFRRYRLNQHVSTEQAWITGAEWDDCARPDRRIKPGAKVVLGFDGSVSNDSTALVAVDVQSMHAQVVGLWERPQTLSSKAEWRVPRGEVVATIDKAFRDFKVLELAADPYHWRSELDEWQRVYGARKVLEFPTASLARMAPASDRARTLILDRKMSHNGDKRLAQHVTNAIAVETPAGVVLRKDERKRTRKVDAAMALVIALDRAAHYARKGSGRTAAFRR